MLVVNCHDGNVSTSTNSVDLSVGEVYKFDIQWSYGGSKPKTYEVEFCEVYNGATPKSQYRALIFHTSD